MFQSSNGFEANELAAIAALQPIADFVSAHGHAAANDGDAVYFSQNWSRGRADGSREFGEHTITVRSMRAARYALGY